MKTPRALLTLTGALAAYVILAALHRDPDQPFIAALTERLVHPTPPAWADESGTRLKAVYIAGADGSRLHDAEVLHDSELGIDCKFAKSSDGQLRCLPVVGPDSIESTTYFKDDQCTPRVVGLPPPPPGCTPDLPRYIHSYEAAPYCGTTVEDLAIRIYPLAGLIGTTVPLYRLRDTTCEPPGGGQVGNVYYDLLAELPATAFQSGVAGNDPPLRERL